jgi:hypothetical protein
MILSMLPSFVPMYICFSNFVTLKNKTCNFEAVAESSRKMATPLRGMYALRLIWLIVEIIS